MLSHAAWKGSALGSGRCLMAVRGVMAHSLHSVRNWVSVASSFVLHNITLRMSSAVIHHSWGATFARTCNTI
eukprot:COSAG01_NODE_51782_length_352_cov_0.600791_1_plen_71_part_10